MSINWITPDPAPTGRATFDWANRSLALALDDAMERFAGKLAIDDGEVRFTYAQVRRAVRRLAAEVHATVPLARPVCALVRNDAYCPIVLMALGAANRPVVILDAAAPAERQAVIIRESGAGAVLIPEGLDVDRSFIPADLPVVDARIDPSDGALVPLPDVPRDLDAFKSINFTSGSTGRPKGIPMTERQVLRHFGHYIARMDMGPDDVVLGIAALTAAGPREAVTALLSGASVRMVDLKRLGIQDALRAMREDRVTVLGFLASPLRMLMQLPGIERSLAHMRSIDLVGETVTASDIALFRSKLPADCRIFVTLGSMDAGSIASWMVDDSKIDGLNVPVGYLDPGRTFAIVDEDGRSVPDGEPGEVVVSDDFLPLGYMRGGVVDDSFASRPGDPGPRTRHTGDVVRRRPDGLVEFVGRRDRMVKVRGLRADLGEIEAAMRTMPEVADAVVVASERDGDSTQLTAFVTVIAGAEPPSTPMLRDTIAAATAEHMVPHAFRFVDAIPRLVNGKADLVRLNALAGTAR